MLPAAPLVKHGRLEEPKAAAAQLIMLTQSGRGECLLVAQTGPSGMSAARPLSGAKQTLSKPHSAGSTYEYTPCP
jgi:hypothetical protein